MAGLAGAFDNAIDHRIEELFAEVDLPAHTAEHYAML